MRDSMGMSTPVNKAAAGDVVDIKALMVGRNGTGSGVVRRGICCVEIARRMDLQIPRYVGGVGKI